jgi:hypothetical protein
MFKTIAFLATSAALAFGAQPTMRGIPLPKAQVALSPSTPVMATSITAGVPVAGYPTFDCAGVSGTVCTPWPLGVLTSGSEFTVSFQWQDNYYTGPATATYELIVQDTVVDSGSASGSIYPGLWLLTVPNHTVTASGWGALRGTVTYANNSVSWTQPIYMQQ